MFALVDCNAFFASCEMVFRPDLRDQPVVVLSNNDGCVVARSAAAKPLVPMQATLYSILPLIRQGKVHPFSANPVLYKDMSRRVIQTLQQFSAEVEQYSIDEAFLSLKGFDPTSLEDYGQTIRHTVQQWTGIPVSVGIAPTKTLAKLAAQAAKGHPQHQGVFDLSRQPDPETFLARIPVGEIWGIGSNLQAKLQRLAITTALQLKQAHRAQIKQQLGIQGLRTVLELGGTPCFAMQPTAAPVTMRIVSRSFGHPVTTLADIKEAVATYTSRCAEKLRADGLVAGQLTVSLRTSYYTPDHQYAAARSTPLEPPSHDTGQLIHTALELATQAFTPGYDYLKAKVIATHLTPDDQVQGSLLAPVVDRAKRDRLMATLDQLNRHLRPDAVKFAALGLNPTWTPRADYFSQRYTTHWQELATVKPWVPPVLD
jgi:DNA polymerase V